MSRLNITFMLKPHHLIVALLCAVISPQLLQSQNLIIDPPSISFQKDEGATFYVANTSVLLKVFSNDPWVVTCIAEPLIHESNGTQISTEQILLKHDLVQVYQPMNTTIDLGNGEPTGGQEMIINTLLFQVSATGQEQVGNYNGVVRFFLNSTEAVQLLLNLTINSTINMTVSAKVVNFTSSISH